MVSIRTNREKSITLQFQTMRIPVFIVHKPTIPFESQYYFFFRKHLALSTIFENAFRNMQRESPG